MMSCIPCMVAETDITLILNTTFASATIVKIVFLKNHNFRQHFHKFQSSIVLFIILVLHFLYVFRKYILSMHYYLYINGELPF